MYYHDLLWVNLWSYRDQLLCSWKKGLLDRWWYLPLPLPFWRRLNYTDRLGIHLSLRWLVFRLHLGFRLYRIESSSRDQDDDWSSLLGLALAPAVARLAMKGPFLYGDTCKTLCIQSHSCVHLFSRQTWTALNRIRSA